MRARISMISLVAIVALLGLPALARAGEGTNCFTETVLAADGRIVESTIPNGSTFWYLIQTTVGRSYSVEIKSKVDPINTMPGNATFFNGTDGCGGVSTLTTRDIRMLDPQVPANGTRRSFTAVDPADSGRHRIRLVATAGTPVAYTISVSDTTMFSPGWSTFGVSTFWSFYNTTNATINGTLTLLDSTGAQIAAVGLGIPTGQAAFPSTITMAIGANMSGTARFTHDGPPGAILAEAAITNFAGFFQRVRFEAPRQHP